MKCYGKCRIFFIVSLFFSLFSPTSVWVIGVWGYFINQGLGGIPMLGPCESRNCILRNTREIRAYELRTRFARVLRSVCVRVYVRMLACSNRHVHSCLGNRMTVTETETIGIVNVKWRFEICNSMQKIFYKKPMLAKYAIAVIQDGITPYGKCKTSD